MNLSPVFANLSSKNPKNGQTKPPAGFFSTIPKTRDLSDGESDVGDIFVGEAAFPRVPVFTVRSPFGMGSGKPSLPISTRPASSTRKHRSDPFLEYIQNSLHPGMPRNCRRRSRNSASSSAGVCRKGIALRSPTKIFLPPLSIKKSAGHSSSWTNCMTQSPRARAIGSAISRPRTGGRPRLMRSSPIPGSVRLFSCRFRLSLLPGLFHPGHGSCSL